LFHQDISKMRKKFVPVVLILCLAFACKSSFQKDYRSGLSQVENLNYFLGVDYFLKSWDKSPQPQTARALAQAYLRLRDFAQAEEWYNKLYREGDLAGEDLLPFAEVLIANSKYSEASSILSLVQGSADPRLANLRNTAKYAAAKLNEGSSFTVSPMPGVNTSFDEFGPVFVGDSLLLIISDRLEQKAKYVDQDNALKSDLYGWTGNGFLKVYQIEWNPESGSATGSVTTNSSFESRLHIGPVFSSSALEFATITQQQKFVRSDKGSSSRNYTLYPELFFRTAGSDSDFQSLPFNSPFKYSVSDPFFHEETQRLYFSSNMEGGFGGADLYFSEYLGEGKWGEPVNLGSSINTAGNERSPFIDSFGTLYFSSNGHAGLGGLDVFETKAANGSFQAPRNLGSPINSNRDDFGFVKNGQNQVVFASDRAGGKGLDDIYFAQEKEVRLTIQGKVLDKKSGEALSDAVVTLADEEGRQVGVFVTNAEGEYNLSSSPEGDLQISARKTGYLNSPPIAFSDLSDRNPKDSLLNQNLSLERIELGRVYTLENI
jgi:hypothetical protein